MRVSFSLPVLALALTLSSARAANNTPVDGATRAQIEKQIRGAQDRLEQAAREVGELSMKLDPGPWAGNFAFVGLPRSSLGLNVSLIPAPGGAGDGVQILSVSPGSPAAKAGLKANDIIMSFDSQSLRSQPSRTPQQRFLELAQGAKPDQSVSVEYQRDGKLQKTDITPKAFKAFGAGDLSGLQGLPDLAGLDRVFIRHDWSGLGSADLLELSPGLGRYFGTDKGLLVVHAPSDAKLRLQEGDVILDIDGRVPSNASHVLRILSSYRPGEALKLHIMRQQKRLELPVVLPADAAHSELSLLEPQRGGD